MPSLASALRMTGTTWLISIGWASASGSQPVSITDAFEAFTDRGPLLQMTSAISRAYVMPAPVGARWLTSPQRSASSASRMRPVSSMSIATA